MRRSHNAPDRIIPHGGKVAEDKAETTRAQVRAVLDEDTGRRYLANDARHVVPEAGFAALDARAFPGRADVLAGEAAGDNVHVAAPGRTVKGADIVPHGEAWQVPFALPLQQPGAWPGSILNSADGAPSKQFPAQDSAADSRKKCQFTHRPSLPFSGPRRAGPG